MFRRKQDVDRHVNSILLRKRDEKERSALGYQIARLYADIKEYSVAKRYLSGFFSVRENVPAAYQLMGEINEGLGQKEAAIDNYKRALDLGGFVSSNKYLVQKICRLYTEIGTDVRRMEHWLEQLEKLDPKNDMIFKLKAQIADVSSANGENKDEEMENIMTSELVKRPTDLKLRIKLLKLYLGKSRCDEAYDVAVTCDLTTAFADALPWYECLTTVFKKYGESNPDTTKTDPEYNQHYLHVLRNLVYLSLPAKELDVCVDALSRFDQQLKVAVNMASSNETWTAMLKEMKGQMFFLASLVLLKRAQSGCVSWEDVNHLSGACLLASKSMDPLDAQAPWFVSAPLTHRKFYDWWHRQSYDRLSQVGHMLGQLSQKKKWDDITEWGLSVRRDTMTSAGHQRVFEQLYRSRDVRQQSAKSFIYQAQEMVAGHIREREPFTEQHLLDIDRVASQVHLGNLNHLVWLCLQRYLPDMKAQPNYHFTLMENIQFSVKNLENTAVETLSQLDILIFLLTSVRCAASAVSDNILRYSDSSGRPSMLPVCLAKPLCSPEQEEWWTAAFRFCTNNIKDDFSRLRRVLVRGLETVRLVGSHGISVKMMCHIARSLDTRVKSYRSGQHGCRCSAYELNQLEGRAVFYWEKAKQNLQRTHHTPMPNKRLFKEAGDTDMSPLMLRPLLEEAQFALALHDMKKDRLEEAINAFKKLNDPWAKFYSAKIYKILSDREPDSEESLQRKKALASKARDCLYDTIDRLEGDKSHELNVPVYQELDELDVMLHALELDERVASPSSSFHTPLKSPSEMRTGTPSVPLLGQREFMAHSTPRQSSNRSKETNGSSRYDHSRSHAEPNGVAEDLEVSSSSDHHDLTAIRPRPSPERLDAQLKSVTYSQSSMFKMVLERNDELIMINSKLMEELRDNNNQLKSMLSENQGLMSDLKSFLGENRDMMKQIKSELGELKAGISHQHAAAPPPPPAPIAPTPPLYLNPHMAGVPPRGPHYPAFPPPAYPAGPGYMPMPGPAPPRPPPPGAAAMAPQYRPSGLPGAHTPNVGKYRSPSDEDDEEVDPDDLTSAEEAAALYADYCDEAAYSQYFTPDSHIMQDWSGRPAMEGPPPPQLNMGPPAPMPPRMSMPSPGYFASALRGQALQYAQNTPPPTQVRPPPLGPGFFSSPLTSTVTPATATSTPSLFAALTGQSSVSPGLSGFTMPTSGVKSDTSTAPVSSSVNLGPTLSGLKSLFQSKGVLETTKAKGDVTILVDTNSRRATILMMGETKDIIFHHDIQGLALEQSPVAAAAPVASVVIWTATKIGTAGEREKVSLGLETPAVAAQLKEAIQRATILIQPKNVAQGVISTPQLFGNPSATSTPMTAAGSTVTGTQPQAATSIFSLQNMSQASTSTVDGKPTFGGFTFSTAPVIAPTTTTAAEKPKAETLNANQNQTAKPFANFTLTPSATASATLPSVGQKSPQAAKSPGGGLSRGDDDHVEEYEPNVDFKPVIALPELVEKTTGEENETALFVERCRLYRFDQDTKQWKERGVGDLKILSSNDQVKFRIIMRRDQVGLVIVNLLLK
ncbi:E3 SUMO-protein ligase RanBP2-like [Elysia marginata]|uniref:E3 SUMO-protein ligase RanBP2-like n=1 Tax=Elysia marginata TaxID=1093978 RepID=A0AAV4J0T4_9GAST|nr:E3 SUMO-protein ligase RanBP2-like [Elysia marginata]